MQYSAETVLTVSWHLLWNRKKHLTVNMNTYVTHICQNKPAEQHRDLVLRNINTQLLLETGHKILAGQLRFSIYFGRFSAPTCCYGIDSVWYGNHGDATCRLHVSAYLLGKVLWLPKKHIQAADKRQKRSQREMSGGVSESVVPGLCLLILC